MPLPGLLAPTTTASPPRHRAVSHVAGLAHSLNLAMETQEKFNWCWAAVSVSVWKFKGLPDPLTQCEYVDRRFKRNCCDDPDACDERFVIDPVIFTRVAGAFPFETVKQLIDAGRLVTVRITWSGGGTHFVCIDGYNIAGPAPRVSVKDPFYGPSLIPYDKLVSSYQDLGAWTDSYSS